MKNYNELIEAINTKLPILFLYKVCPKKNSNNYAINYKFWLDIATIIPSKSLDQITEYAMQHNPLSHICFLVDSLIQEVLQAAASMKDGDLILLDPAISCDIFMEIAKVITSGTTMLLHPDTPVHVVEAVAASLNNEARLCFHPRMKISTVQAGIMALQPNGKKQLLPHPRMSENCRSLFSQTSHKKSIQALGLVNNPLPEAHRPVTVLTDDKRINIADKSKLDTWAKSQNIEYIHTDAENLNFLTIEQHLFMNNVCVLGDHSKAMGIYTSVKIKNKTRLGEYQGERKALNEPTNMDYVYRLQEDSEVVIDALRKRNWLAMVNSASSYKTANAMAVVENNHIYYETIADILPNQQILIFYGDTYQFDVKERRFINANNNWLESCETYEYHVQKYHNGSYAIDSSFEDLFGLPRNTHFLIPKLSCDSWNIPLLAINTNTRIPEPQCRQENITPLMLYCWKGELNNAKYLLANGADANIQSSISGISAMHLVIASTYSDKLKAEFIHCLLQYGALLEIQDKDNQSVLHWAIKTHRLEQVRTLRLIDKQKCLITLIDDNNDDAFIFALKNGTPEIVNVLTSMVNHDDIKTYIKDGVLKQSINVFIQRNINQGNNSLLLQILDDIIEKHSKSSSKRKLHEPSKHAVNLSIDSAIDQKLKTIHSMIQSAQETAICSTPHTQHSLFAPTRINSTPTNPRDALPSHALLNNL